MRGLDISSTKYLEMNYFIDSLISEHEAFQLYCENHLLELGIDPAEADKEGFSSKNYPEPDKVDNYIEKRRSMIDGTKKLLVLKEYYLNLLSISEFVLYNSVETGTNAIDKDIPGKNAQKLKIQELERSKISSDLHDSSIQILTGLVHKCELIQRLLDFDIQRAKLELSSVVEGIKQSISNLRGLIFNLRAPSFLDFSLKESIEDYTSYKNKDRKVIVKVTTEGDEGSLNMVVKSNIYRICQEAFNNVLSHSNGDRAEINIKYTEKEIILSIKDNGVGVDLAALQESQLGKKHFGILIMKERTEIIGGKFEFISSLNQGAEVRVVLPKIPLEVL